MKTLKKSRIFIVLLLVVPVIWILIWKAGEHFMTPPEIMGQEEMDGTFTPFIIPDFRFTNQDSQTVTLANFENQIMVVNFFYATCPKICPKMQNNVHLVVNKFRDNPAVAFLSHTVNPESDSVPVLNKYAEKYGYPSEKWQFVTGEKQEIYRMAENHYRVVSTKSDGQADFIHSTVTVLVDKERRIRGYFESIDNPAFYEELSGAIKALIKEDRDKDDGKKQ